MPAWDIGAFVQQYFLGPRSEHTGYNIVNTLAYAGVALVAVYAIYWALRKAGIRTDAAFAYAIIPFVFFGSLLRVAADALDPANPGAAAWAAARSPLLAAVNGTGINLYDLLATPGVYLFVGAITLVSVFGLYRLARRDLLAPAGWACCVPVLLALAPLITHADYFLLVLGLATAGVGAYTIVQKAAKFDAGALGLLAVFAHSLDGAATYVSVDVFPHAAGIVYVEQHVLANAIASAAGGFWAFFALKVAFASAAAWYVARTFKKGGGEEEDAAFVLLLVVILGLAPGVRDAARLLCGV